MVDGKRGRGRPEKSWLNINSEWTGLKEAEFRKKVPDREIWNNVIEKSVVVCPHDLMDYVDDDETKIIVPNLKNQFS